MEYGTGGASHEIEKVLPDYAQLVADGLQRAESLGFNLADALDANYGQTRQSDRLLPQEVLNAAAEVAAEAELDAQFFERPARTVLLLGAADALVETERRAAASNTHDYTVDSERHALADLVLIAAGSQSGVARAMRQTDQAAADRYILADKATEQIELDAASYLNTLENSELAIQIQALFDDRGDGSLLAAQRERLGIPSIAEHPVRIRVLMLAQSYQDLLACGYVEPVGRVWSEKPTPESELADAKRVEQEAKAAPLLEAYTTYYERYGAKLGTLAPAWATCHDDGSSVITLTAPYAYGLLRTLGNGTIPHSYAGMARHEFTHGQRPLFMGAHIQLGMTFEERRAVWNSDGAGDYVDARLALDEINRITNVDLVGHLAQAMRTEDPYSSYLCSIANKVGLRTAMLLSASKPAPYTRSSIRAARFVDLRFMTRDSDGSEFDAIVRDTLARRGAEQLERGARTWLAQLAERGYDRYLAKAEVTSLVGAGLEHTQSHYEAALLEAYGPPDPNAAPILIIA